MSSQSIVNSREFMSMKQLYEIHTVHELRRIATNLQIPGRSCLRKQELIDAIMDKWSIDNWCRSRIDSSNDQLSQLPQLPQLSQLPQRVRCSALYIYGSDLHKCTQYSGDHKYCSGHANRYRLEKPDDCPVCMDTISSETETPLECGHWVHKQCLVPTNRFMCPVCRQTMKLPEIKYVFGLHPQHHNAYDHNHSVTFSRWQSSLQSSWLPSPASNPPSNPNNPPSNPGDSIVVSFVYEH